MSLVDLGKRLLEAAKQGMTNEVRALMSNGAPFTTDWLGTSPLHFAAMSGHAETAEVLLRAGISRDARTKVDRTPLHVASQEGHVDIVDLLIRNGADVEAKDMLKMTPLHWAVEKGHFPIIEILMRQGADVSCANKFDKTPVDIAICNGRPDIAEILQLHKQNIIEVTTDQHIVEEVTATETIGSEVVATDNGVLEDGMPTPVLLRAKQEDGEAGEDGENNTAVLATLAALAEATGPLNAATTSTTAADALNWLETHGITMIANSDSSSIVTSSLESGQNLILTEAGKMALNFVKQQGEEGELVSEDGQVITIVTDQNQETDEQTVSVGLEEEQAEDEPPLKKIKTEGSIDDSETVATETITMTMAPDMITQEEMVEESTEQVVLAEEDYIPQSETQAEELVEEEDLIREEES